MDPSYTSEKTGRDSQPPAYQVDMRYPPAQGVTPSSGQGYNTTPYGAQPSGAQPYGAQPYGARPYGAQPSGAQPSGAQPYGAQPYGAQPYRAQPYGAQPYGAQAYSGNMQYSGQAGITNQPTICAFSTMTHMTPVPDYMVYSIFTLLCCCCPLGVTALIFSINAKEANVTGNRDLALQKSRMSLLLNNIAVGLGLCLIITSIIIKFTVLT